MTIVSDQTQPVVRNPNSTTQSDSYSNPAVPSNVKTTSSNQRPFFDACLTSLESALVGAATSAIAALVASNKRLITRRLTSPGEFTPGSTNYDNRPKIIVVRNTTVNAKSVDVPVGDFSDWYLSQVQEQDLERTDVTETFGAPHIFTSGRFTRKVVFSGMVRTTAHNFASNISANRVPQHVLLRNFYENFLRATMQAQMNYFTRIVVDGDIYEGYIVNLQLPRDSGVEMVMPFAMTMICVRRYNVHDADAIASLSVFQTKPDAQLPPAFASASMKDATGDFKLSLEANNTTSETSVTVNTGKVNPDGSFVGVSPVINLHSSYGGQVINIDGDGLSIWTLQYADDGSPVSGTACRGGARAIKLVLSSFANLVDSGKTTNGQSTRSLKFFAGGKEGPTLQVVSVTSDRPSMLLKSAAVILSNGARYAATLPNDQTAVVTATNARAAVVSLGGSGWSFTFDLLVELATADKVVLPAGAISSPPGNEAAYVPEGYATAALAGKVSSIQYDIVVSNPGLDTSAMVVSTPAPGKILFAGLKVVLTSDLNLALLNPFALADSIVLNATLDIEPQTYAKFTPHVQITLDMGKTVVIDSLFDKSQSPKFDVQAIATKDSAGGVLGVYRGTFKLSKSAAAQSFGVTGLEYQAFLGAATVSLQYNQGAVACRVYQSTKAQLQLKDGPTQIPVSVSADVSDPETAIVTVEFTPPASMPTEAMKSVLSSVLSGSVTFPPVYQMAAIPLNFK